MLTWLKQRLWPQVQRTLDNWGKDGGGQLAAATSYYAAFSFFPLMLVLIAGFGLFLSLSPGDQQVDEELIRLVGQNFSRDFAEQLRVLLDGIESNAGVSGPLGIATLMLGAMGIFAQIEAAFDKIWKVPPPPSAGILGAVRRALFERLHAFLMMAALGLLVIASFIAGLVLSALGEYAAHLPAGAIGWRVLQIAISIALNALVFACLYKVIPEADVKWRDVWLGAFLAALIWEVGRQILSEFIIGGKYGAYGVVGSFIAIMAWIYYASMVLFIGAEFVHVSCSIREEDAHKAEQARQRAEFLPAVPLLPPPSVAANPAGERAAYAAGGALAGLIGALLLAPIGLLFGLIHLLRRLIRRGAGTQRA